MVISAFLFGVSLYAMRRSIVFKWLLFFFSILIYYVIVIDSRFVAISTLPLAYVTVFVGLQNPSKTIITRAADYSYGIYLYGFPLQQTVSQLLPAHRIWYINVLLSVPLAFCCAYLSWTFVESKVLAKRKTVLSFVSLCADQIGGVWAKFSRPLIVPVEQWLLSLFRRKNWKQGGPREVGSADEKA
jgi:peptidoglycan/LPS O-acetylase OafA/YrhL